MSLFEKQTVSSVSGVAIDQGLRAHLLRVYQYMMLGLALTASTAFLITSNTFLFNLFILSPLRTVFVFAPLGIAFFLGARVGRLTSQTAQIMFWAYAFCMGVSVAFLSVAYVGSSLVRSFFMAACVFGSMSLYGYTTKRDLSRFSSILTMALLSVIIAGLANVFFFRSSAFQFLVSCVSLLVFTGLTAYDTQNMRNLYYSYGDKGNVQEKLAIMGALNLYLNFLNIFYTLLHLFGERK